VSSVEWNRALVRDLLSEVYLPEGIEIWLQAPNKNLGNWRPCDLIERGDPGLVVEEINRLRTGSFS
jgi:uncharacterized protein (DUF2384 family)